MKKFRVILNGVDATHLFNRFEYRTAREPVYVLSYTDLDQVDHYKVARWRGTLYVTTNGMKAEDAAWLAAQLMQTPLQVTYYSFQLGAEVTETMRPVTIPAQLRLIRGDTAFVDGVELVFEGV